jgi:hypothetical protein
MWYRQDDSRTLTAGAPNIRGTKKENLANGHTSQRQVVWGCPRPPDDCQLLQKFGDRRMKVQEEEVEEEVLNINILLCRCGLCRTCSVSKRAATEMIKVTCLWYYAWIFPGALPTGSSIAYG